MVMNEENVVARLQEIASWNDFARSVVAYFDRYGRISDRQLASSIRMLQKMDENAKKRDEMTTQVDMRAIETMFGTALANGLKRPGFICGDIKLSLAMPPSRNAGMIYVKYSGEYQGKIDNGTFHPVRICDESVPEMLKTIAADPFGSAIGHGKETGVCACCGRQLTDPESVKKGIGPICAVKWGFT